MIVKVQLSRAGSGPRRMVLIYNQDRSVRFEGAAEPDLIAAMGGRDKAFFHATVDADGILDLLTGEPVPDPGW